MTQKQTHVMAPELLAICQSMLRDGVPVSVAMLKAKSPGNYPLQAIIKAVKLCKSHPETVLREQAPEITEAPAEMPQEEELILLRSEVKRLETRLSVVETKLAELLRKPS